MPGMAGMAGGLMGMPGYMGGMAGMAGGFMSPWGIAGGMAGGFMTGGMMDPTMMQQQYLMQLEMQRQYTEQAASRMRLYQSFMSEYMQFQMKWNQYFGSGAAGGGGNFYYNPSIGTNPVPGGGSGPGTGTGTTPGRTR